MSIKILVGDCRERLEELESDSVQLCVTSPPYFGLRDYGVDGQIGLEGTIEEYVTNLVEIFREVRRVLQPSGTLVMNLGDSYARQAGCDSTRGQPNTGQGKPERMVTEPRGLNTPPMGLKAKDLCGIPWRVALALQADGWYLRRDMFWVKRSAMPESCKDRPTTAHEYIFLLSKRARYFWDREAIRNGRNYRTSDLWFTSLDLLIEQQRAYLQHLEHIRENGGVLLDEQGESLALDVTTTGFKGAHFAVFPEKLVLPFVRAGTSQRGVCPQCKAPWVRVIDKGLTAHDGDTKTKYSGRSAAKRLALLRQAARERGGEYVNQTTTIGWQPTCSCNAAEPVPALVLDPFSGAGTTLLVADREGRDAIGCELSPDYAEMARGRLLKDGGMFTQVEIDRCDNDATT